jgi:hypothetical protein
LQLRSALLSLDSKITTGSPPATFISRLSIKRMFTPLSAFFAQFLKIHGLLVLAHRQDDFRSRCPENHRDSAWEMSLFFAIFDSGHCHVGKWHLLHLIATSEMNSLHQ